MPNPNEIAQKQIYDFLTETAPVFNLVKKYSILIEELLPENKAPIHAANELKSLVFHLYNTTSYPDVVETNIIEAKEHLCRAFYDLHSMVVSIYIKQISGKVKRFKLGTIASVCPEYSQILRPQMRDIQENLREIRSNRNTDMALLQIGIKTFEEQTKTLAKFDDIIEGYFPDFNQFEKEESEKIRGERRWDMQKIILTALISTIIGGFLGYWIKSITTHGKDSSDTPTMTTPTH